MSQSGELNYHLEIQAKYEELIQRLDTVNDLTDRREKEKLFHACGVYAPDLNDFQIGTLGQHIEEKPKIVKCCDFVKAVKKEKRELEKYNQLPQEVQQQPGGFIHKEVVKDGNNTELAKEFPEKIDTSNLKPMSSQELIEILGLTIKKDEENKLITFLCELSAYTEDSQLNISFNAPSSTGKSYIPTEIAQLFPEEDVIEIGYCSPTAFSHDVGTYEKEKEGYIVDLSRKILIFLDQPHTLLLQHLRPFLSHDKQEIRLKITDKSQKAGLKIDEQEITRFLLLSPETNQEKIREAVYQKIKKETDCEAYRLS